MEQALTGYRERLDKVNGDLDAATAAAYAARQEAVLADPSKPTGGATTDVGRLERRLSELERQRGGIIAEIMVREPLLAAERQKELDAQHAEEARRAVAVFESEKSALRTLVGELEARWASYSDALEVIDRCPSANLTDRPYADLHRLLRDSLGGVRRPEVSRVDAIRSDQVVPSVGWV